MLKDVINDWSDKVGKILCYEHQGSETEKIHVHLLIMESPVKDERLKRIARARIELSGNEDWSWKKCDMNKVKEYMTYMTKGVLRPVFVKNFSTAEVEEARSRWVEPKGNDNSPATSQKRDELDIMEEDYLRSHDINSVIIQLGSIRTWTMAWYWRRYGKLPIVSQYKRNAGSLYLRLVEEQGRTGTSRFDFALEEIKELWY